MAALGFGRQFVRTQEFDAVVVFEVASTEERREQDRVREVRCLLREGAGKDYFGRYVNIFLFTNHLKYLLYM